MLVTLYTEITAIDKSLHPNDLDGQLAGVIDRGSSDRQLDLHDYLQRDENYRPALHFRYTL